MNQYHCRNILVPVDLSEASLNALDAAASLAQRTQAQLIILNVEDDSLDFLKEEMPVLHSVSDHSIDVVSALANAIQHKTDYKPEVIRVKGAVAAMILQKAMEHQADLIVMGSHGASGYRDGFMGTNAYTVMKYAPCPVLTVPPQKKWNVFRRVLYPVRPVTGALSRYDVVKSLLTPQSQLCILGLSYQRAERDVSVLENLTMEISARVKEDRIITRTAWSAGGSIAEDVLSHSVQDHADLIVLSSSLDVTNKPNFIGPNVQKVINNSRVPVLHVRKQSSLVTV